MVPVRITVGKIYCTSPITAAIDGRMNRMSRNDFFTRFRSSTPNRMTLKIAMARYAIPIALSTPR